MAGDFSAILGLVASIVKFILEWTINLICCCIYLVSFVLPWRIFEEFELMDESDWRCNAIIALMLTIFDLIAIPLGAISLLSILRWPHISKAFTDYSKHNRWDLRFEFFLSFFSSLWDFFAFFCFLCSHLFPSRIHLVYFHLLEPNVNKEYLGRVFEKETKIIQLTFSAMIDVIFFVPGIIFTLLTPTLWHCTYVGLKKSFTPLPNKTDLYGWDDCYWMARMILISRVPYALYDLICIPFGLLAILSPFRHTAFRISLVENGMEMCAFGIEETPLEEIPGNELEAARNIPEVPVVFLNNDDSLVAAAGTTGAAPPLTSIEMEGNLQPLPLNQSLSSEVLPNNENLHFNQTPSAPMHLQNPPARTLAVTTLNTSSPNYNSVYYNVSIRRDCMYFGVTALVDLLLLPILLPLVLTWYRYAPIRQELFAWSANPNANHPQERRKPKPWGFREYGIISRQFCFLILDLLFLPIFLLTFLTQYRWLPIRIAKTNDDLVSYRSLEVYSTLLWTLVVMIADLLILPFALVVIITYYRNEPLLETFFNKRILFGFASSSSFSSSSSSTSIGYCICHESADDCCAPNVSVFFLHLTVICNFLVILHDFIIAPLLFTIAFFSGVRTARTVILIRDSFACPHRNSRITPPSPAIVTSSAPPASDYEQSTPESMAPISSTVPQHYTKMTQDGNPQVRDPSPLLDLTSPLNYPDIFPTSKWRMALYLEAINSLLDLPFALLAIIVIFTGWRASSLLRILANLETEFKSYVWYRRRNSDEIDCWCCDCCCCCCTQIDINWKRRGAVVEEFILLLRDLLFLFPLFVIVATLYRLPSLLLDLISRCYPMNRNSPCLVPVAGKIAVPDSHGPICINLTCRSQQQQQQQQFNQNNFRYSGPVKLYVDGTDLWSEVGQVFGDSVMRIGKGMLPLKLVEGTGVATGIVKPLHSVSFNKQNDEIPPSSSSSHPPLMEQEEKIKEAAENREELFEVWIQLDLGATKRTTILKNLKKLSKHTSLIIQLEAQPQENQSSVVVSVTPTIDNLVHIFEQETDQLLPSSLDENLSTRHQLLSTIPPSNGIVEDFWIIVALHFAEIVLDICHFLLVLLICLVPWRLPQLLCSLFESDLKSIYREVNELYKLHCDAQKCLSDYLTDMSPLANSLAKSVRFSGGYVNDFILFSDDYDDGYGYNSGLYHSGIQGRYNPLYFYSVKQIHSRLKKIEEITLKRFEKDSEKILHRAEKGGDEIRQFGSLLSLQREVQLMRLAMWGFRCSAHMMKESEVTTLCQHLHIQSDETNFSFASLLAEVISNYERGYLIREKELKLRIHDFVNNLHHRIVVESQTLSFTKRWNGLFKRSKNDLRKIIRNIAMRALRDVGLLFLTLFILITMVRVIPLWRDLYELNSWSITSPTTQRIILKHLRGVADDLKRFLTCLFFVLIVFLLGVGVPSFLKAVPKRLKSLEDTTNCAKEHIKETLRFFCEVLSLFAAWRTYKLIVTAGIYAALVPPACIAEAIPRRVSSVQFRFIVGSLIWFGLVIGAILLSVNTNDSSSSSSSSSTSSSEVRHSFMILYGLLIGIIGLAACSLSRRSDYTSPIKDSATGFLAPTWSHLLSLLLGPVESLQLASVVLYFFWNGTQTFNSAEGGSFTFPVVYLFDSNTSDTAAYGYSLALGLTAVCVFIWIIIVSIPLIYDSDDKTTMRNLQKNPAFDAIYSLLSRLIFVSIVATLLRPYSCVERENDNSLVLSTNSNQDCGGNDSTQNQFSSNVAATILLLFFMLTSTIFHSDAPDLLSIEDNFTNSIDTMGNLDNLSVRFAPLYAIVIRLGQFLICYLCFGLVSHSDRRADLIAIIILSFVLFLWSGFYPFGRGCSVPCVSTLRSVGFLVVMWSSIVCYCREETKDGKSSTSSDENSDITWTGYLGLLIAVLGFWLVGVIVSIIVQRNAAEKWKITLKEAGIDVALEELISTADQVFVEDALGGGTREGKQARKELFIKEIKQTLTTTGLGQLLIRFEEKILADRLSYEFIQNRSSWRRALLQNESLTYRNIANHAQTLKDSIVSRAPVALLNKHVLACILENKLPEYVAWEVFKFLYDVEPLCRLLSPLMALREDGQRPLISLQSYGHYSWWQEEAYTVTLLRLTKTLLYRKITENRPTPSSPPLLSPPPQMRRLSNNVNLDVGVGVDVASRQNMLMEREWSCSACTLSNPSFRNTCGACGKVRNQEISLYDREM